MLIALFLSWPDVYVPMCSFYICVFCSLFFVFHFGCLRNLKSRFNKHFSLISCIKYDMISTEMWISLNEFRSCAQSFFGQREILVCTLTPRMRMWVNPNAQANRQTNKQNERKSTLHFTYIVIYTVWNLFDELLRLNGSITFVFLLPRNQKSIFREQASEQRKIRQNHINICHLRHTHTKYSHSHARTHACTHKPKCDLEPPVQAALFRIWTSIWFLCLFQTKEAIIIYVCSRSQC